MTSTKFTINANPLKTTATTAQNSDATHISTPCPVRSDNIFSYGTHSPSPIISIGSNEFVISYLNNPILADIVLSNGGVNPTHGSPVTFSNEKNVHDNAASSDNKNPINVRRKTHDLLRTEKRKKREIVSFSSDTKKDTFLPTL